jgi:xanthine dehydrogenase accessory factor
MNAEADAVKARNDFARPHVLAQTRVDWLQPMRTDWPTAVCRRLERRGVVVRVVVAEVFGSAPREAGACMLVDDDGVEGTIGGGNLEWRALELARASLRAGVAHPGARVDRLTLGRELAQCCGGVVRLFAERFTRADLALLRRAGAAARGGSPAWLTTEFTASVTTGESIVGAVTRSLARGGAASARLQIVSSSDGRVTLIERIDLARTPVWLYGAGHVGQAVVRVLADLPFAVTWLDSRSELFPGALPDNVRLPTTHLDGALLEAALASPRDARHIVMTHDHGLDYALCRAILERNEFAWLGLIGSESKAARFRSRLKRDGLAPERIARLVCPIGLPDIGSKLPAAIAIGIAAQLLRENGEIAAARTPDDGDELSDDAQRSAKPGNVAHATHSSADVTASGAHGTQVGDMRHGDDCDGERCASCHRTAR